MELTVEQRFVWLGFLMLAGDSSIPGKICISERMGYSTEQIAELLNCPVKLIDDAIALFVDDQITVSKGGVIEIIKWKNYQSEYLRQVMYGRKLPKKVTTKSDPLEVDVEVEVQQKKKEITDKSKDTHIARTFIKPTAQEVTDYSKSIGFTLDGQYFIDYQEARGWKLKGNITMKSWKATVGTWKKNNFNTGATNGKPASTKYAGLDDSEPVGQTGE